ncbi:MAG: type II toxin-antitoxin system RelB/DinJ family antitoxin [Coriobacteriia bacterium]|nr:type II toxin-antitoxin system RelB/DinJ family antitoxin [Coriobacteriia bacterium]
MPKTADLKLRIDPDLKRSAIELYGQWGLNLTDAITMFLYQSVAVGGLPFAMRSPKKAPPFNWDSPSIVKIDPKAGHAVLPAEWDADEDSVYDSLQPSSPTNSANTKASDTLGALK